MVAVSAFSGLVSSPWAFASAVAIAPMVSLDRCIGHLLVDKIKADGTRLRALRPQAVADGLPGILRDEFFQFRLGAFMLLMGGAGPAVGSGKVRPCVGGAHIDDTDRLQTWPRG